MKYSPVPTSPQKGHTRPHFRLLRSPVVFYLLLIGLSFGAGYLCRTLLEYWRLISRIRNAGGHDLTVKHVKISMPTNSEPLPGSKIFSTMAPGFYDDKSHATRPVLLSSKKPKTASCSKCSLGLCNEPDPSLFTEVSTEIQLYLSLQFPCSGKLTQWKLVDYNPTPGKIVYIDVIRYLNDTDRGTWMGTNTIKTTGEAGWVIYDIPKADQIEVERGWLVSIHYDDVNGEGVIPHTEDPKTGLKLYDGFGLIMDHQELGRLIKMREESTVPITAALKQLLVELHHDWRAPALAATVEPSNGDKSRR